MSDPVIIAIIAACATIPSAAVGIAAAYFSYKAAVASHETKLIAQHTEENTNHMKDELVALTRSSAHAEGVLEGKRHPESP